MLFFFVTNEEKKERMTQFYYTKQFLNSIFYCGDCCFYISKIFIKTVQGKNETSFTTNDILLLSLYSDQSCSFAIFLLSVYREQ